VVIGKLPLDSPLWDQLSACYSTENAIARLREIVASRQLGEAWSDLRDEILHQGTVYEVSSAAIPHLVDVAPYLPTESRRELWIEIGFLVTAGADRFPSPPAPGLQEGLTTALRIAETLAVRDFLADTDLTLDEGSYYALACVALSGHRVGEAMWEFPSASSGYVRVVCAGCGTEYEVDGFADPLAPPCPAPTVALASGNAGSWQDVADAIERSGRDQVLGSGWADFFETARWLAAAGVPSQASASAVWCLVAAMVATRSAKAAPWARTLARLAGHVRCLECGTVWAIADVMDDEADAEPVDVANGEEDPNVGRQGVLFTVDRHDEVEDARSRGGVPPSTIADGVAGFPAPPARKLRDAQVAVRTLWHAEGGGVDALTLVAGRPSVVVAGGSDAVTLWDIVSGSPVRPPMAGAAAAVASVALPDGRAVIAAAGDDYTLRWWDASTGRPLDGAATAGPARIRSLAPVLMPPHPGSGTVDWLARLRDGSTVLACGDTDGVVRLWDPVTRTPVAELFQRAGWPVVSMTAVDFVSQPPWDGTDLVVLYDQCIVDVWSSIAVHGNRSTMAPDTRKLAAVGHRRLIGAAVSPQHLGYRKPILLGDRNGTVSMWETFGVRLNDPLPPDPAHRDVVGIVALPAAGDGIAVVTASREDRNLRVWEPLRGSVALVPLDIRPRCLLNADDVVLIGHDDGLLAISLASIPVEGP
jgi:WD40 repeat protein